MKTRRYSNIEITKDKKGRRYYKTTYYPPIEPNIEDIYITSKAGDRLDHYAHRYYGDSRLWTIIAQANHIGKGTLVVEPGLQIRIPKQLGTIQEDFNDLQKNI